MGSKPPSTASCVTRKWSPSTTSLLRAPAYSRQVWYGGTAGTRRGYLPRWEGTTVKHGGTHGELAGQEMTGMERGGLIVRSRGLERNGRCLRQASSTVMQILTDKRHLVD